MPSLSPGNIALPLTVACGGLAAVQAQLNATLADHIHSSLVAALVSFGVGFSALVVIVASRPANRAGLRKIRQVSTSWWLFTGGFIGAAFVATATYTAQELGVAVFIVTSVGGQMVGGLIVDQTSLSPAGRNPITWPRACGAVIAVAGAVITQIGKPVGDLSILPMLAMFTVGMLLPAQTALNARVSRACGSAQVSAMLSFAVGTIALAAAVAIATAAGSGASGDFPVEPWLYAGGLFGATFIVTLAWAGQTVDVLRLGSLFIGGQLLGGLAVDGLVPGGADVSVFVALGATVTLLAVLVMGQRKPSGDSPPNQPLSVTAAGKSSEDNR